MAFLKEYSVPVQQQIEGNDQPDEEHEDEPVHEVIGGLQNRGQQVDIVGGISQDVLPRGVQRIHVVLHEAELLQRLVDRGIILPDKVGHLFDQALRRGEDLRQENVEEQGNHRHENQQGKKRGNQPG